VLKFLYFYAASGLALVFSPTRNCNDTKSFPFPRTKWLLMGRAGEHLRPAAACMAEKCGNAVQNLYNLRLSQCRMMCQKLQPTQGLAKTQSDGKAAIFYLFL